MKIARFSVVFVALGALLAVCYFPLFGNLWKIATGRGFYIPTESSVFTFKVTRENEGSGEWWVYAQDRAYFYFAGDFEDSRIKYIAYSKSKVPECVGFDPMDSKKWCKEHIIYRRKK